MATIDPKLLSTLHLRDHDIVVLRGDISTDELDSVTSALQNHVTRADLHNVLLIHLHPCQSIRTLSEEEMRLQGWERCEDAP